MYSASREVVDIAPHPEDVVVLGTKFGTVFAGTADDGRPKAIVHTHAIYDSAYAYPVRHIAMKAQSVPNLSYSR